MSLPEPCDTLPQSEPHRQTQLIFVRHGHVHNPRKVLYGRLPRFRLSKKGHQQAQSVAHYLKERPIDAIFSSPLLRARQTANQILHFHPTLKLQISEDLTEVYTPYEGWASHKIRKMGDDLYTGSQPPFEQPRDIVERILNFIARARKNYQGQQVVVVTHGDNITFMILWAKNLALTPQYKRNLSVTGILDHYPATTSTTTFIYRTTLDDERPEVAYTRPDDF